MTQTDEKETKDDQKDKQEKPKRKRRAGPRRVWLGVLPDGPLQSITVAGTTFHLFTEKVSHPENSMGKTQRSRRNGQVIEMDAEQLELLRARIEKCVVRRRSAKRVEIINPDVKPKNPHAAYKPKRGDQPLADFVYLVDEQDAVDMLGPMWAEGYPPSYSEMYGKK